MRIKTIVIDDDAYDLNKIQNMLDKISSETVYQFTVSLYSDADSIPVYSADWYIVDIDLNGRSGFDLANVIKENDPSAKIIFCTNHDDLVYQSFETDVFYFIRKDKLYDDLMNCIKKYVRISAVNYAFRRNGEVTYLSWDHIIRFEISKNDLFIYTRDSEELSERKTMKQLLQEIPEHSFLQPSSHDLVNCSYVQSVRNDAVILKNGTVIPVVRDRSKEVKKAYLQYLTWR